MDNKELLLKEIEQLLGYNNNHALIDRALLKYLDEDALKGIKSSLLQSKEEFNDEEKAWLAQFRKER